MKKKIVSGILGCLLALATFAQTNNSVPLTDSIYLVVEQLQLRGLFPLLPAAKPYSERQLAHAITDVLSDANKISKLLPSEEAILFDFLTRFDHAKQSFWKTGTRHFASSDTADAKVQMDMGISLTTEMSAGLHNLRKRVGFDIIPEITVSGMFWNNLSINFNLFGDVTRAPLDKLGTYHIGDWWNGVPDGAPTTRPKINTYANDAYFPFAYRKRWDGSVYMPGNLTAEGLEGWPTSLAMGFGIYAEMGMAVFNDTLTMRFGRIFREWGGMEHGASLVLNAAARPFVGAEFSATLFKWLSFSSLIGSLEMPNTTHITGTERSGIYAETGTGAAFQNLFSVNMLEANFKYFHFDFGTTVIMPKRFEFGYLFPLMSKLIYQNNIGDFDNIALFADMRFTIPNIATVWASLFLDEMTMSKTSGILNPRAFLSYTRNMYAFQVGANARVPFVPFTKIAIRYTKIEPYCYTHNALNKTPWYTGYISEAYVNNGAALGYYLPPNSDEVFLRVDSLPIPNLSTHLQYQFIRHGADYGERAVRGSSIYSELSPDRASLRKYFLRDGAYQWIHVLKIGGEYNFRKLIGFPLTIYGDIGYVYSYFTDSDTGTGEDQYQKGSYSRINTSEYPTQYGAVITIGIKIYY
ncbi:MAG: hypothetical protein IJ191_04815 [Treponema sp.]|nr:hypothetical protein [Treponema sp.]